MGYEYGGERLMARNIKYMLTQTVRVDGLRYTLAMTAALLAAISKDELKDYLERGILEEVPDIGASIGGEEPDARDELIESLNDEITAHEAENQRMTAKAKASAESFVRLGVVHDDNVRELKKSQSEVERLKTENANVKRELQEAGDDSQAALKKAQVEIDDLKAQIETLKADADKAKAAPKK